MFEIISKNTLAQLVGKVITLALSLLTTRFLTHLLGDGYGQYAFVTAFVLLFGTISDWGTNTIAVREASKEARNKSLVFANVTFLRIALALLGVLLLNIVIRLNPNWKDLLVPLTVGSFVLIALSLKSSIYGLFQTILRYDLSSTSEIISSLILTVLVYFIYLQKGTLTDVLWAWFFATAVAALLAFFLSMRQIKFSWRLDKEISTHIFKESISAGALFIVFSVYNRLDIILLQHFRPEYDVSIYGLAYKLYDQLVLGAAFFMNATFPYLSRIYSREEKQAVKNIYQKSFDILLVGATVVGVLVFVFAPQIISLLAPATFLPAASTLRILLFAMFFAYFNHLTGYSLIAFGKQRTSLIIAIIALVFNFVTNWIFIPLYSFRAAALITVATEGLVLLLSSLMIYKTIGLVPSVISWTKTFENLIKRKNIDF